MMVNNYENNVIAGLSLLILIRNLYNFKKYKPIRWVKLLGLSSVIFTPIIRKHKHKKYILEGLYIINIIMTMFYESSIVNNILCIITILNLVDKYEHFYFHIMIFNMHQFVYFSNKKSMILQNVTPIILTIIHHVLDKKKILFDKWVVYRGIFGLLLTTYR